MKNLWEKSPFQPTPSHWILTEMVRKGLVKHIVSQNIDGLHMWANTPADALTELHGNIFLEKCEQCGTVYKRDKPITTIVKHLTGNKCEMDGCTGALTDTILEASETISDHLYGHAKLHSQKADLALVLGSSLRVSPACYLPTMCLREKKGVLVICNRQATPMDSLAKMKIHAATDVVLEKVAEKLGITVKHPKDVYATFSPKVTRAESKRNASVNTTRRELPGGQLPPLQLPSLTPRTAARVESKSELLGEPPKKIEPNKSSSHLHF